MHQIDVSSAVAAPPAATAPGPAGYFTDGDPVRGIAPTIVPAEFLNALMGELLGVLSAGGVAPIKGNNGQVAAVILAWLSSVRADVQKNALLYAPDTGAANAYRAAYAPPVTALIDGMLLYWQAANANSGAATFAPNGLPAAPLVGSAHSPLQGGEIAASGKCCVAWHAGVNAWILLESTGGAMQIAPATAGAHAIRSDQLGTAARLGIGTGLRINGGNIETDVAAMAQLLFMGQQ
jgi:hypothetical protein